MPNAYSLESRRTMSRSRSRSRGQMNGKRQQTELSSSRSASSHRPAKKSKSDQQDAEEEPVLVTSKRILCKNVPAGMVEQNVINFFQQRCQCLVEWVELTKDEDTKLSRALLQFQAKKGVAEAIRQIHDKTFEDIKAKLPLRVYQEPESDCEGVEEWFPHPPAQKKGKPNANAANGAAVGGTSKSKRSGSQSSESKVEVIGSKTLSRQAQNQARERDQARGPGAAAGRGENNAAAPNLANGYDRSRRGEQTTRNSGRVPGDHETIRRNNGATHNTREFQSEQGQRRGGRDDPTPRSGVRQNNDERAGGAGRSTAALSEKRGARENFPPLVVLKNIPSEMPLREVERIAKMIGETDRVTTFKLKSGTSANGSGRAAQTVNSARIQYTTHEDAVRAVQYFESKYIDGCEEAVKASLDRDTTHDGTVIYWDKPDRSTSDRRNLRSRSGGRDRRR